MRTRSSRSALMGAVFAVRAAMVLLGLLVVAGLVVTFRGSLLLARGQALVDRPHVSPAEIALARQDFRRAARLTPDTEPRLREAGMNLVAGRPRSAVVLLRGLVQREPENYRAWAGLRFAAARVDPELSRRAAHRLTELNPRQALPALR